MKEWITGRNPVYEVIRARKRDLFRLRVAQGAQEKGRLSEILSLATERRVTVERVSRESIDRLGENPQGIALECSGYPYSTLLDIIDLAKKRGEPLFVLLLDVIQNPQNLGTLLRTAEAVGIHGVLIPLKRAAGVTPAVVTASAGASEHLLIAESNLAQAITTLKDAGAWVVGLEGTPEAKPIDRVRLDGSLAVVVGSEGEGMRLLVRKSCDVIASLPMMGKINSFNAAVAGSIILYQARQQRGFH